jgi:hypothetical protein
MNAPNSARPFAFDRAAAAAVRRAEVAEVVVEVEAEGVEAEEAEVAAGSRAVP